MVVIITVCCYSCDCYVFYYLNLGPLHAKEDQVRDDTVEVCRQLAKQCSEASAIDAFIKQLFDVFFGSDGKLTVTTHKMSVLQVNYLLRSIARRECLFSCHMFQFYLFIIIIFSIDLFSYPLV